MIVYLWKAGTAEGIADAPWRARRRAADSMRRLQEQAARIDQAHFVLGTESLHAGYHRAPGDPYWIGRQYPSGRVNWQPGERAPEPTVPRQPQDERGLSRRQREVAELVATGLGNPQIAERLGISRHTVMTHLTVVYEKTGTGGGGQAARERLAAWLQQNRQPPAQGDYGTVTLTPRQPEAARLFAAGVPREKAAARLKIATRVLDARLRAVRAKTGTGDGEGARDRLAGWLADHGLPADELAPLTRQPQTGQAPMTDTLPSVPRVRKKKGSEMTGEETPAAGGAAGKTAPLPFDVSMGHQARMYDYVLGGKDNYAADRAAADEWAKVDPGIVFTARANRAFLGRVVRYLAGEAGIRQFLDIGTGIPTAGNTHQVAQVIAPESRVVYVDYDPIVLAHARALLDSHEAGATGYIDADLRDTGTILGQAAELLDLTRPVAITLLAILHVIPDADDPHAVVGKLLGAMPAGSYLALSHLGADLIDGDTQEGVKGVAGRMIQQMPVYRSREQVARFFDGTDLVAPGLVRVEEWRPDPGGGEAGRSSLWCGAGRKG